MGELGKIHQLIIPFLGHNITLNLEVILMTWIVFVILILVGFLSTRKRGIFPKAMQMFGELLVSQFYGLTEDALDKEMAKTYGPLICALFMFLVLANWLAHDLLHIRQMVAVLWANLAFAVDPISLDYAGNL